MHYYIDGYNMLFRIVHEYYQLQKMREKFIEDLSEKIHFLNLDVTLVFDASFQSLYASKQFKGDLEIIFTSSGETADEYIVKAIEKASHPKNHTVVTSDKNLARHIRDLSGKIETVENFVVWLNSMYQHRKEHPKVVKSLKKYDEVIPAVVEATTRQPLTDDEKYLLVFEKKFEEIRKVEEQKKEVRKEKEKQQRKPRTPKKKIDPFNQVPRAEEKQKSEMERWLKAFQEKE